MQTKSKLNKLQKSVLRENVKCFEAIETKLSRIYSNFLIPPFDGCFLKTASEIEKTMSDIRESKNILKVFLKENE